MDKSFLRNREKVTREQMVGAAVQMTVQTKNIFDACETLRKELSNSDSDPGFVGNNHATGGTKIEDMLVTIHKSIATLNALETQLIGKLKEAVNV